MSLQTKVLLPILALIVLLMVAAGVLSYSTAKNSLGQILEDNLEDNAASVKRNLAALVESAERDILRTTHRSDVTDFLAGDTGDKGRQLALSHRLKAVSDSYPDFERMSIYDAKGDTIACSNPDVLGQNFADREYFSVVKSTRKPFSSAPFLSRVSKSLVMVIAAPLFRDGVFVGVLTGNLNMGHFYTRHVAPIRVGASGFAFVLDPGGLIAMHPQKEREFNKELPEIPEYQRLLKKGHGLDSFVDPRGDTIIVYLETDEKSGLTAVVRADERDAFSGLTDIRNKALMVAIAGIILGSLVVFSIIRPVVKAVKKGALFAERIAEGDLGGTLDIQRKDEIGHLADALRKIPESLKRIIAEYARLAHEVELGKLDAQGDADRFAGDYATLIKGANSIMRRYRMVLDSFPSPLCAFSPDNKAVFLNKHATDLVGTDYKGKGGSELFRRDDAGADSSAMRRCRESKRAETSETHASPKGKSMEISYTAIPVLDNDGQILCVLQMITDLTAIKSSQRTMMEVAAHAMDISSRVATSSEQLSAQVTQVSQGAEMQRQQAASTAAAMEEMNATVLEVAKNASQASRQSEGTRTKAQEGEDLVRRVVGSITRVNTISQELQCSIQSLGQQAESVGKVMNVISDIADQTNLLALNAAIEAARAGEAGRGFAVVADEVRKLAENTMNATTEVGGSIKGIQAATQESVKRFAEAAESVSEATSLAETSGQALHEILAMAEDSSQSVAGIATAAEEQSATSEEINRAIDEINRIADETAAGMGHSASAVREIATMSQELNQLLERLKA